MALFTQAEITTQLTQWKAALVAISEGQSSSVTQGGDTYMVERADLDKVTEQLIFWGRQQAELDRANNCTTDGRTKNPLGLHVARFN